MEPATIETERMILRPWRDEDLESFARLNADPRVMEFFPAPLTRAESDAFAARIRAHFAERGYGLWAVELPGRAPFIGFIGLQWATFAAPFTPALEVGFRFAAEHWEQGYATEGGRAAVRFAFERAEVDEVVSFTAAANLRSERVIEKIGLVRDAEGDFEHPRLAAGHWLRRHRLYRIPRAPEHSREGARPGPA